MSSSASTISSGNTNVSSGPSSANTVPTNSNPSSAPSQPSSFSSSFQINDGGKVLGSPSIPTAPAASNPNYHHYQHHSSFQPQQQFQMQPQQLSYSPSLQYAANDMEYYPNIPNAPNVSSVPNVHNVPSIANHVSEITPEEPKSESVSDSDLQEWVWMFAEKYYTGIHSNTAKTHLFYKKDSVAIHGLEGEKVSPKKGQAEIRTLFTEAERFQNCRFRITNIDYQNFVKDMIVIQVIGEMATKTGETDELTKTFVQTFIMATAGDRGFYILSDILRFLNEEESGVVSNSGLTVELSNSQAVENAEPTDNLEQSEIPETLNEPELANTNAVETVEPEVVSEVAELAQEVEETVEEPKTEESHEVIEPESETVSATIEEIPVAAEEPEKQEPEAEQELQVEQTKKAKQADQPKQNKDSKKRKKAEKAEKVEKVEEVKEEEPVAAATPTGPKSYAFVASNASSQPAADIASKLKPAAKPAKRPTAPVAGSNTTANSANNKSGNKSGNKNGGNASNTKNNNAAATPTSGAATPTTGAPSSFNRSKNTYFSVYIKCAEPIPEQTLRNELTKNFGNVSHFQARSDKNAVYVDFATEAAMKSALAKRDLEIPGYLSVLIDKRVRKGHKNGQSQQQGGNNGNFAAKKAVQKKGGEKDSN